MSKTASKKSKDKNTPAKGQMTLSFTSGRMAIANNSQASQNTKPKEEEKEVKEDVVIRGNNSEVTVTRKRKFKDISNDSKTPEKSQPSKRKKVVDSEDEKENIDQDEVAKMENDLNYGDVTKMKNLTNRTFDPIKDAPYKRHQHIPFSLVAKACMDIEEIKGEKSQDLVKETLANVFRTAICLKPSEIIPLFYFFICKLGPEYEGLETGVGNEMILNAIIKACGKSKQSLRNEIKKTGDMGTVAAENKANTKSLTNFFKPKTEIKKKEMTVLRIFETFTSIAKRSGSASVADKTNSIMKLLMDSKPNETKFLVRWLEGNLKIGAAEKTVVSALARAFTYTPGDLKNFPPKILNYKKTKGESAFTQRFNELEETIKEAVCVFPNYNKIIEALLESGTNHVEELPDKCYMRVGVPVKPMLAKPTNGIHVILKRFEGVKFTCEYKYDGFRGQIHYQKDDPDNPGHKKIGIFSRNLENMTETYPDAVKYLEDIIPDDVDNFIIDSEIVPYDMVKKKILPFQVLTTRSRKNVSLEDVQIQVCLFVFDILYLNNQNDVIKKTFRERRELMKKTFTPDEGRLMFAVSKDAERFEEIEGFLNDSINDSCEGLMIKTLEENSTYHPSKRSFNWLKLKKDYLDTSLGDSLDLVVVGADFGKGKRTGMYGSFLFA